MNGGKGVSGRGGGILITVGVFGLEKEMI